MLVKPSNLVRQRPEVAVSDDEMAMEEAGFALDFAQQLEQLREISGLTQDALARLVGTTQQQISRMENPEYQPSFRMVRKVLRALRAYLDPTVVPHERLDAYARRRYQPVIHDQPDPFSEGESAVVAFGTPFRVRGVTPTVVPSAPFTPTWTQSA